MMVSVRPPRSRGHPAIGRGSRWLPGWLPPDLGIEKDDLTCVELSFRRWALACIARGHIERFGAHLDAIDLRIYTGQLVRRAPNRKATNRSRRMRVVRIIPFEQTPNIKR